MPPTAKSLREDLARAKAAYAKGDDLRTVQLVAAALRAFLAIKPAGPDRTAIESLLRESFAYLGKMPRVLQYLPKGIPYAKGQEPRYAAALTQLAKKIEDDLNQESLTAMRERKLRLDHAVIKGTKLLAEGNLPEAQRHFRAAVDDFVDETGLFPLIASRLIDAGHFKPALEYLRRAIEVAPDNSRAYDFLIGAVGKAEAWDQAERLLADLQNKVGPQPLFLQCQAMVWARLGKWPEAYASAKQALTLDPHLDEAKRVRNVAAKQLDPARVASGQPD